MPINGQIKHSQTLTSGTRQLLAKSKIGLSPLPMTLQIGLLEQLTTLKSGAQELLSM